MQKEYLKSGNDGSVFKRIILPVLLSLGGTVIALYPNNPNNMVVPSRDSGVFLYVGWRILNGEIPYRDIWDHKPPFIYYIDALGLSLVPNSTWGVWAIEFIFMVFVFLLMYKVLDKEFGGFQAAAGTIILASGLLSIVDRGNVTEEYALLFQAIGIYLFSRAKEINYPLRQTFWIGLCGGLAFCLKQTTIAIWVVFALMLVLTRFKQKTLPFADFLHLAAGLLIPIMLFALYFYFNNALSDFWDEAFGYNFLYIRKHEGLRRLIPVFIKGFAYLRQGWVLYVALAGWLSGVIYLWLERRDLLKTNNQLVLFAVLALPIEVIFILISGRSILHYYLTPLPVMALISGVLVYVIPKLTTRLLPEKYTKWNVVHLLLVCILILAQIPKMKGYDNRVKHMAGGSRIPVIEYVTNNTNENDKILIIGAETVVNFLARRDAPTRYVYQYPLALTGNRQMFEEYFNQILEDPPTLIIDSRGKTEITEKLYVPLQKRSEIVEDGVQYLGEHYEHAAQFGEWFVYRLKEKQ